MTDPFWAVISSSPTIVVRVGYGENDWVVIESIRIEDDGASKVRRVRLNPSEARAIATWILDEPIPEST